MCISASDLDSSFWSESAVSVVTSLLCHFIDTILSCRSGMTRFFSVLAILLLLGALPQIDSLPKRPFWKFLSGGALHNSQSDPEIKPFVGRSGSSTDSLDFMPTIRRSSALDSMPYAPLPLDEKETSDLYIPENAIDRQKQKVQDRRQRMINERNRARENEKDQGNNRWNVFDLQNVIPKVNFRCDPLVNFKLKQRLVVLGACVTLGMNAACILKCEMHSLKIEYCVLF